MPSSLSQNIIVIYSIPLTYPFYFCPSVNFRFLFLFFFHIVLLTFLAQCLQHKPPSLYFLTRVHLWHLILPKLLLIVFDIVAIIFFWLLLPFVIVWREIVWRAFVFLSMLHQRILIGLARINLTAIIIRTGKAETWSSTSHRFVIFHFKSRRSYAVTVSSEEEKSISLYFF